MNAIFTTERLVLRAIDSDNSNFIFELLNSEGWLKYIGDRNIKTIIDAQNYIKTAPQASYLVNGFGLWLITNREDGTSLGICGLLKRDYLPFLDIGYALLPQFYGLGYAQEAVKGTIEYAENKMNIKTLQAIVNPDNRKSIKLLNKVGFDFVEQKVINSETLNIYIKKG